MCQHKWEPSPRLLPALCLGTSQLHNRFPSCGRLSCKAWIVVTDRPREKAQHHLHIVYTVVNADSKAAITALLKTFKKTRVPQTVSEFTSFFHCHWMVTKRQVFAHFTNQSFLSALLSSCPSHQCHHMSQPISGWLKVLDQLLHPVD